MQAPKVSDPQIEHVPQQPRLHPDGDTGRARDERTASARRYARTVDASVERDVPDRRPRRVRSDDELVNAWIERNDAQNYVLLGDPAVRIRNELLT